MPNTQTNLAQASNTPITLPDLFKIYLKMGFTAFGPAIAAETKKNIVDEKKWVSQEEFLNGLALAQLVPGATFVSLTVYIGYKLRGFAGAVISFLGFLIPSFFIMVLLSFLYSRFGDLYITKIFLKGVMSIVVGIIAKAILDIGKSSINNIIGAIIAIFSFVFMYFFHNIFVLLIFAAIAGILFLKQEESIKDNLIEEHYKFDLYKFKSKETLIAILIVSFLLVILMKQPLLFQMGLVFFKMGALVFGNGFTIIPLIQQEVVNHYHWLTLDEFSVGLAFGQITPGPVLITSTFIGYKVAKLKGALVATLGIFLPSLFLVTITAEGHKKIKNYPRVKAAIKGILAAFVGMMLLVLIGLAKNALIDGITVLLAICAFIVLRFTKINTLWVVIMGSIIYMLVYQVSQII